jgi:hypothetical protein
LSDSLFRYIEPFWSIGDRFELTLAFPDEPTLRAELAPLGLGLERAGDVKIGGGWIDVAGVPLFVTAFGATVMLTAGPDDRYEHVLDVHREQVKTIEDALRAHGLEARVIPERLEYDEDDFLEPPNPKVRRPRVVVVEAATSIGFRTRTLHESKVRPHVDEIEITEETQCFAGGAPFAREAVREGMIARPALGTGKRADGAFGAIAARLDLFIPGDDLLVPATQWAAALAPLGIAIDPTRFAALHMIDRVEGETMSIDQACARELAVARFGRTEPSLSEPRAIVDWMLRALKKLAAPCLFDARAEAAREDAKAVHAHVIERADAALDAANDGRRFFRVTTRDGTSPMWLLLRESERDALVAANLAAQ